MSTFRGIVAEFPDIRIDYFRHRPGFPPALACFLSHIHSDHLQGLEGFYGGPFIYCSEATRELLIRLERRAHRINFAKQVVEAHDFTYAEKKLKLKAIPLETPTKIELGVERYITVTLFDANHCPGAVMFLIEDDDNSILYTGDIRAEPWWVDATARHPVLIPYSMGLKRLTSIYLDTSFASREELYADFPTKAEGIRELIEQIMKYPKDTTFHLNTWTFGYEDVWVALSAAFDTKFHVDDYQHRLFRSIREKATSIQGPYLNGFSFGNSSVEGRLTKNPSCRFHSCDKRLDCPGLRGKKVVYIVPIITRVGNIQIDELAIGQGDLESHNELPLNNDNLRLLVQILGSKLSPQVQELLLHASHSAGEKLPLEWGTEEKIAFSLLSEVLSKAAAAKQSNENKLVVDGIEVKRQWDAKLEGSILGENGEWLPTRIYYPFSRHSSHNELRHLIGKFRPLDVYPCVVDENNWSQSISIKALFGDLCSGRRFAHDEEMQLQAQLRRESVDKVVFVAPDGNSSVSEQEDSSQLIHDGSQHRDSDEEEMNKDIWLQRLRTVDIPIQADLTKTRSPSPIKAKLKREVSNESSKDDNSTTLRKRIKSEVWDTREIVQNQVSLGHGRLGAVNSQEVNEQENSPGAVQVKKEVDEGNEDMLGEAVDEVKVKLEVVDTEGLGDEASPMKEATEQPPSHLENPSHERAMVTEQVRGQERNTQATPTGQRPVMRMESMGKEVLENEILVGEGLTGSGTHLLTLVADQPNPLQGSVAEVISGHIVSTSSIERRSFHEFGMNISCHLPLHLPSGIDEDFDIDQLREATASALGIDGKSWWSVSLQSTRRMWGNQKEPEL